MTCSRRKKKKKERIRGDIQIFLPPFSPPPEAKWLVNLSIKDHATLVKFVTWFIGGTNDHGGAGSFQTNHAGRPFTTHLHMLILSINRLLFHSSTSKNALFFFFFFFFWFELAKDLCWNTDKTKVQVKIYPKNDYCYANWTGEETWKFYGK